ncbi:MAG: glutamine-hydrolyzing GMP synthase [Deltaproteobacteria bacterium]|nr:glutamine-hydrolyzing GMP synthase [Deltaproteobacteria bacterium]
MIPKERIVVVDFGSQYTQLIARRVRESRVYCEIVPCQSITSKIGASPPKGFIFSGSPSSVHSKNSPRCDLNILKGSVPVLGICYGMQLMTHQLGGQVELSDRREFGRAEVEVLEPTPLFQGVNHNGHMTVWMSHGDRIQKMPPGFKAIARTGNSPVAAMSDSERHLYGVQFHPEVVHTPMGRQILENFILRICGCAPNWTMRSFLEQSIEEIREKAGDQGVVCALSGGVDSSVVAALIHRAIGKQLTCIFVDNGLLRMNEREKVEKAFKRMGLHLKTIRAEKRFLDKLRGITDPEQKRKMIGNEFIFIFEEEAKSISGVSFLAQGTLYPDVIESFSHRGPSATIKTHHNVGGLPKKMRLKLLEPLRELFKDEVRLLGKELGVPDEILKRHPFPGPGLAVRILGEVTEERLELLKKANAIVEEEIQNSGLYHSLWQAFAVLLPVKSVGVMGDERTYENVLAVRAVESQDGMTADWARLPADLLGKISNRVINEVSGINRVVYDISSKPPSTIEWE